MRGYEMDEWAGVGVGKGQGVGVEKRAHCLPFPTPWQKQKFGSHTHTYTVREGERGIETKTTHKQIHICDPKLLLNNFYF